MYLNLKIGIYFSYNLEKNLDIKLSCELDNSEIRYLKIRPHLNSSLIPLTPTKDSIQKLGTDNLVNQNGLELVYSFKSKNNNIDDIVTSFRLEDTPNLPPEIKLMKPDRFAIIYQI